MQGLKRPQKEKVRAFQSFTGASEAEAIDCLKACDWRLDAAADRFRGVTAAKEEDDDEDDEGDAGVPPPAANI